MLRAPREPIKPPNEDRINLSLAGRSHQFIELWPRILRPGFPNINILVQHGKFSGGAVGPQVAELKLAALVFGTNAGVTHDSHLSPPKHLAKAQCCLF